MDMLKALFIGNSYTYCNNMPWIVSKLADSADVPKTLEVEMVSQGGVTLEWHFNFDFVRYNTVYFLGQEFYQKKTR